MSLRGLVAIALMVLIGCHSKTQQQVFEEAKPAATPLRAKLVAAANLVDKRPPTLAGAACKSPKPLTFDPSSDKHDTDFMMLQEALRGAGKETDTVKDEYLKLYFPTYPFARTMRGTSPTSIYASYTLTDYAKEDFKEMVKRGLNVKNVVIVRSRLSTMEYFLVDLAPAAPVVVCTGAFTPTGDPTLGGAHSTEYTVITKNKRTGKEVKRESKTVESDPSKNALYKDAAAQFGIHMNKELGLVVDVE